MDPNPTPPPTATVEVNGIAFTHGDLHRVVAAFYTQVAVDPVLAVPLASVRDWP